MDRYAVIGNPVAHSLSPRIHRQFADQTNQRLSYERIEAPLGGFAETVAEFFGSGGKGVNVTVPFKGAAAAWVDVLEPLAEFTGSVNTIVPTGAGFKGCNTDGPGLLSDLQRLLGPVNELKILLLGAGGAARGVAWPLLESLAAELHIANRTVSKAEEIAASLGSVSTKPVRPCGLSEVGQDYDLIINATSAGLEDQTPEIDERSVAGSVCYDMVYGGETAFCRWARGHGADSVHDGLGMLVAQAALAFELWRGVAPDTEPVLAALAANAA
jgi:shikimate dehydrogenase